MMVSIYAVVLLAVCYLALSTDAADPPATSGEKKVVCYYTSWSHSRISPYGFTPDKIDPFLCTHIIYAFAHIGNRNNLISADPEYDFNQRAYANITALKKINKNLKVMLSVGGWKDGTTAFAQVSSNDTNRKEFAKNAVRYIRGYQFDGLDLNWQHPTFREGGKPEDKENYVLLAQTLREEFEREATMNKKPRLLLSIAIVHHQKFLPGYDIANFDNYMDFISVICYDYHFSHESSVNHHSPLYALEDDPDYNYDSKININYTIHYFMDLAHPDKLILGIPTYGRSYKLDNPDDTALGSFADGPGEKGPITGEKGFFAYYEICNFVNNENWTVVQPKPGAVGPYAFKGDQWVGYDDIQMVKNKAKYAKDKGLGGVMFWTIDYDDFLGQCDEGSKFPIIRAAKNEFSDEEIMVFPVETEPSKRNQFTRTTPIIEPEPFSTRPTISPTKPESHGSAAVLGVHKPDSNNLRKMMPCGDTQKILPKRPVQQQSPRMQPTLPNPANSYSESNTDVNSHLSQSSISRDLVQLIERAGGLTNLCKLLRLDKSKHKSRITHKHRAQDNTENSIVFESPNMPPVLFVIANSSIYIKEFNVYQHP